MPGFGFSLPLVADALIKGVAEYIAVNGVLLRLLTGYDDQPLKGYDGQYLYGRAN